MHVLQQKHSKLKLEEVKLLLEKYNIAPAQLPKIFSSDPALPKDCKFGDIVKIEREDKFDEGKKTTFSFRVVT